MSQKRDRVSQIPAAARPKRNNPFIGVPRKVSQKCPRNETECPRFFREENIFFCDFLEFCEMRVLTTCKPQLWPCSRLVGPCWLLAGPMWPRWNKSIFRPKKTISDFHVGVSQRVSWGPLHPPTPMPHWPSCFNSGRSMFPSESTLASNRYVVAPL